MSLKILRQKIDHLDQKILNLIHTRMELSQSVIQEKKEIQKPILDTSREVEIFQKLMSQNQTYSPQTLNSDQIKKIWLPILEVSREIQSWEK